MLKFYLILAYLILFIAPTCQSQKESPPGTFLLRDNLFIDRDPVLNIDYALFLAAVEQFWSPEISEIIQKLPKFGIGVSEFYRDKGIDWRIANSYLIKSIQIPKTFYDGIDTSVSLKKYFVLDKIRNIPVTGVTYEQAEMYCKWRTYMVTILYAANSKNAQSRSRFYSKFMYRLPTIEEWEFALTQKTNLSKKFPFYQMPVYNVPKYGNRFFAYKNILGELVSERDLVIFIKGEKPFNSYTKSIGSVNPQVIGFRCVCEVVE